MTKQTVQKVDDILEWAVMVTTLVMLFLGVVALNGGYWLWPLLWAGTGVALLAGAAVVWEGWRYLLEGIKTAAVFLLFGVALGPLWVPPLVWFRATEKYR